MKRSKKITLLFSPFLSTVLLSACGDAEPQNRDVYQSQEECLRDWNEPQLCERMNDEDEREYHRHNGVYYPVFWGPTYYGSDRTVVYQGRDISPKSKSSTLKPYLITSKSSSASRTGVSSPRSPSVRTGGFGSSGVSSGS